jgi:hypothetical protein
MSSEFDADDLPDGSTVQGVLELLEQQRNLLIAVATGGPRIQTVEAEYQARRRALDAGLARLHLKDPFPYNRLWEWYAVWSSKMHHYYERRLHINQLADPIVADLEKLSTGVGLVDWGQGPETWANLDARLNGLKQEMDAAVDLDDLQDVGRRAREVVADAANLVFAEDMVPIGEECPSPKDAKRRIGYFLDNAAPGASHDDLRKVVRAAMSLMQTVTHSDTVARADAFAAAQTAVLIVRTLHEIQTRSGPEEIAHPASPGSN